MQRQHEPMARRPESLLSVGSRRRRARRHSRGRRPARDRRQGCSAWTAQASRRAQRRASYGRRWVAGRDRTAWGVDHDARQRPPGVGQDQGGASIVEAHEGWPPALAPAMLGPGRTLEQVPTGRIDGQGIPAWRCRAQYLGHPAHASPSTRCTPLAPWDLRAMATRNRRAPPTAPWTNGLTTSSQAPT